MLNEMIFQQVQLINFHECLLFVELNLFSSLKSYHSLRSRQYFFARFAKSYALFSQRDSLYRSVFIKLLFDTVVLFDTPLLLREYF